MIRGIDKRPCDWLDGLEPPRTSSLCRATAEACHDAEKKLKLYQGDQVMASSSWPCLLLHLTFQGRIIASSRLVRPRITAKTISFDSWFYHRGLDWLLVRLDPKGWYWLIVSFREMTLSKVTRGNNWLLKFLVFQGWVPSLAGPIVNLKGWQT